jgi:uncharacterized protein YciI
MFLAILTVDPARLPLRERFKADHDRYWDDKMERIRIAGPQLTDDGAGRLGQILILDAPDRDAATALVMNDPFVAQGLFSDIQIRRFRISVESGVAQ